MATRKPAAPSHELTHGNREYGAQYEATPPEEVNAALAAQRAEQEGAARPVRPRGAKRTTKRTTAKRVTSKRAADTTSRDEA